jgi:hypothetical protein
VGGAYQGVEETTCTLEGLVQELVVACPDEEKLDALIAEGHALAQGQPIPKKPPQRPSLAYENTSDVEQPKKTRQKKHLRLVVDNTNEPPPNKSPPDSRGAFSVFASCSPASAIVRRM